MDKTTANGSVWTVAEAKNRFSELMTLALRKGPQRVHRRNEEVVLLSAADYQALCGQRADDFKRHLLAFPGFDEPELHEALQRAPTPGRDVQF